MATVDERIEELEKVLDERWERANEVDHDAPMGCECSQCSWAMGVRNVVGRARQALKGETDE